MRTDFGTFLAWSKAQGISTPLELVNGKGNYRYLALPQNKDTLLNECISKDGSHSPDDILNIVTAPLDSCIIADDWQTLVDRLKYEKGLGELSDFAPWLDLFPSLEDFSEMPRFWTPERRDMVRKYDSGMLEARMQADQLRFDQVDDPWALACVDSRSNFLPDNTFAMTPMLDMINHDARVKTSARRVNDDGVSSKLLLQVNKDSVFQNQLQPTASSQAWPDKLFGNLFSGGGGGSRQSPDNGYQPGAEVFISYGNFEDLETLCNYGFVATNNPHNIACIRVRAMGQAPHILAVDSKGVIDNTFNSASLTDLRVNLATPQELESMEGYNGMGQISRKNEIEVFALVAGELEEALYDAEQGLQEAEANSDETIKSYLQGRIVTLKKGRKWLMEKFPEVF